MTEKDRQTHLQFVRNFMLRFRYRISTGDAEDVLHRAYLKSLQVDGTANGDRIYGFLKFSCLSFFNTDLRRKASGKDQKINENRGTYLSTSALELKEDLDEMHRIASNLPRSQRKAFETLILGLTTQQAADALGTTLLAQQVARSRTLSTIRQELGGSPD